jgi:glycine hydroxymethyltransferase
MSLIENYATDLMKNLFKCTWSDLRLVSGTHANLATFKGLSTAAKNRKMVVTPLSCGAHISHDYAGLAGSVLGLENINHVYDFEEFNIDPDMSAHVIRAAKPGIVTFGGSLFLFPHPIKELKEVCDEVGAFVAYDASHVLGLIAGGAFQDPLSEGADFITSSTSQDLPWPAGWGHTWKLYKSAHGKSDKSDTVRSFPVKCFEHASRQVASGWNSCFGDETLRR